MCIQYGQWIYSLTHKDNVLGCGKHIAGFNWCVIPLNRNVAGGKGKNILFRALNTATPIS